MKRPQSTPFRMCGHVNMVFMRINEMKCVNFRFIHSFRIHKHSSTCFIIVLKTFERDKRLCLLPGTNGSFDALANRPNTKLCKT